MELADLAKKYETDKLEHGYIPFYERHISFNPRAMLEIGCFRGASLLMWDEWFKQQTDIHVLDLFQENGLMTPREVRNKGWVPHIGNQNDISFLSSIRDTFDLIIDDGSHNAGDMLTSFKHLFLNSLAPGGLYVIEDLHCCKEPFYWTGLVKKFEDTVLHMFTEWKLDHSRVENPYFNTGELEVFRNLIKSVHIYDEKILFIERC